MGTAACAPAAVFDGDVVGKAVETVRAQRVREMDGRMNAEELNKLIEQEIQAGTASTTALTSASPRAASPALRPDRWMALRSHKEKRPRQKICVRRRRLHGIVHGRSAGARFVTPRARPRSCTRACRPRMPPTSSTRSARLHPAAHLRHHRSRSSPASQDRAGELAGEIDPERIEEYHRRGGY